MKKLRIICLIALMMMMSLSLASAANWKWIYSDDVYGYYIDERDLAQVQTYEASRNPTIWVKIQDEANGIKYIDNITIDLKNQAVNRIEGRAIYKDGSPTKKGTAKLVPAFGSLYEPFYCYYLSKIPGAPGYENMIRGKGNHIYTSGHKGESTETATFLHKNSIRIGNNYYECSIFKGTKYEDGHIGTLKSNIRFSADGKHYTILNDWVDGKYRTKFINKTFTVKPDTFIDYVYGAMMKIISTKREIPRIVINSNGTQILKYDKY